MKSLKLLSAFYLIVMAFMSYGQETSNPKSITVETQVIAVVNRANWCAVCKANSERFGKNIMPYSTKGLAIVMNDLTDETTIEKSKAELKKSALYKQIYKNDRNGVGRMMKACGIVQDKHKQLVSGIVTFIDAKTMKVLSEKSITITDTEMKTIIDNLLK
jgi:hypothetical protein